MSKVYPTSQKTHRGRLMKMFLLSALSAVGLSGAAFATDFGPLIEAEALEGLVAQSNAPLVLDIRGEPYAQGHIPGAISSPYGLFRGPADNPGALVPEDQLQASLRNLGVTLDRPIVVVHQGTDDSDFGGAARVYWTLKSSGVSQLAILNGGMDSWAKSGFPLETKINTPVPSTVQISFSDRWLATNEDVAAIVKGRSDTRLLDSRPSDFYSGQQSHPSARRPGTLPGSENISHAVWFSDQTHVMKAPAARDLAADLGITQSDRIVTFCNTGHWAATEWFTLSELAGVEDVKLYPDSMVGWSQSGGEMENTPGLWQNLMHQIRGH